MSYSKFKQYGKKFSEHYWGDYVHNIWLRYFEKHGVDVFKEGKSNRWIYQSIKNEFLSSLYRSDKFVNIINTDLNGDEVEFVESNEPSIVDNMVYNELDHFIKEKIKNYVYLINENHKKLHTPYNLQQQYEKFIKIYELIKFNYSNKEIAHDLGVSQQQISYYKKQIREAINMAVHVNPFNGSKVVVNKVITESQWDKRNDHLDFHDEDYNEYYLLKVHSESGQGWLIKLKERDYKY